jgi:hypothetical protein
MLAQKDGDFCYDSSGGRHYSPASWDLHQPLLTPDPAQGM